MGTGKPSHRKPSRKKRRFRIAILASLVTVILLLGGGLVYVLYLLGLVDFVKTNWGLGINSDILESDGYDPGVDGIVPNDPVDINDIAASVEDIKVQGNTKVVTNILLLGVETGKKDVYTGRADSIIIASINKHTKTIKLISLLRDNYVTVPGWARDKLNAAYSRGGFPLLQQTIEKNFRLRIDKFIAVNFSAFSAIVDAMGGVDIELTEQELKYVKVDGKTGGTYHLSGTQALNYSRIRKIGDDWGRTSRQRKVIRALMKKAKSISPVQYPGILNKLLDKASTNMERTEFLGYLVNAPGYLKYAVEEYHLPGRSECKPVYVPIPGSSLYMEALELNDPKAVVIELHHQIYG